MKKVIAGNWKMHHGPDEARRFFESFSPPGPERTGVERIRLMIFPPAIALPAAIAARRPDAPVALGVQNVHEEIQGAFTGEISAEMAAGAGAECALVGHSERRHVFGETEDQTRRKVEAVFRAGLEPVLCVGEKLDERRDGDLAGVIRGQLDAVFESASVRNRIAEGGPFIVAYEPVWAIGTGETATPADASQAHIILRDRLSDHLGSDRAAEVPILYGGSVKPENASDLLQADEVDGVLVGGASLDPDSFSRIAAAAG